MLAGDHRQLSPIIAHDWDNEDRPPAVLYQPFASAYRAIQTIWQKPAMRRPLMANIALGTRRAACAPST